MYKFKAPDGTTHFTNAPTDPRYQRMGFTSGTQAGWLRLPQGDPSPYAREKAILAYGGVPPYPETVDYVGKVLRYYGIDSVTSTPEVRVYQTIARDGTVTYTNIPPRGRP